MGNLDCEMESLESGNAIGGYFSRKKFGNYGEGWNY